MILGSNVLTLADWAKRLDPDGKVADIVEVLSQTNEILDDMLFKEGNLPTGERSSVRTGLPQAFWRRLNQGVQPTKSTTAQIDEACGMLESWSEVDVELASLNGNTGAFRLSEAESHIEGMGQEFASTVFYGNSTITPEEFNGLSVRYSDPTAQVGKNMLDAGGNASDNASIWLVGWGDKTVHGIFPKGSKAGLEHKDLGEQTVEVTSGVGGTRMRAYQDIFKMKGGISVKDWRYVVRICNISMADLASQTPGTPPDLISLMIKATHRIPKLSACKPMIYMNRSVFQYLDLQRRDNVIAGGQLSYDVVDGKRIYSFRGIPVRICDALLDTEDAVTGF